MSNQGVKNESSSKTQETSGEGIAAQEKRPPLLPKPIFGDHEFYEFCKMLQLNLKIETSRLGYEVEDNFANGNNFVTQTRKIRRIIFLTLAEPNTSILSAVFFAALLFFVLMSILLLVVSTLDSGTYIPASCSYCSDPLNWLSGDDIELFDSIPCVCPPIPKQKVENMQAICLYYLTFEYVLRILCYEPHPDTFVKESSLFRKILAYAHNWLLYVLSFGCIIDALSVFPLYSQYDLRFVNALRVFRMFRFFKIPFLAPITAIFKRSLRKCLQAMVILFIYMTFGSIFFGALVYYCEMGVWMYTTSTDPPSFTYMRKTFDGSMEPTPFHNILDACWWCVVTSTTVGYGDIFPTSLYGRVVAVFTMLSGLFVLAIPLSAFCGTWSEEAEKGAEKKTEKGAEKEAKGNESSEGQTVNLNTSDFSNDMSSDLSTVGRSQSRMTCDVQSKQLNSGFGNISDHLFFIEKEKIIENIDNKSTKESLQSQNSKTIFDSISHHLAIIREAREDISRAEQDIIKAREKISQSDKEICCVLRCKGRRIVGGNEQSNIKIAFSIK